MKRLAVLCVSLMLAACETTNGPVAQVVVPANGSQVDHVVTERAYTIWYGADGVCVMRLISDCAMNEFWATPPPTPRFPLRDPRTPFPTLPECSP